MQRNSPASWKSSNVSSGSRRKCSTRSLTAGNKERTRSQGHFTRREGGWAMPLSRRGSRAKPKKNRSQPIGGGWIASFPGFGLAFTHKQKLHQPSADQCSQHKILSHRPTGPAFGRPEDRLQPVPMAEMDPGFRINSRRFRCSSRNLQRAAPRARRKSWASDGSTGEITAKGPLFCRCSRCFWAKDKIREIRTRRLIFCLRFVRQYRKSKFCQLNKCW
jgi:hypothetical protein